MPTLNFPINPTVGQTYDFGQYRYRWDGQKWSTIGNGFNQGAILTTQIREALKRSYAEAGYNLVAGSFETGGTLVNANDVLLHEASGKAFGWSGAFQKVVSAGSTPTPLGSGGWIDRSDVTLRSDLIKGALSVRNSLFSLRDFVSVKDFGAIGDGLSHPLSSIFSTLSAAQSVYPIATSLTQEIDFIAGQTANNYCYAKGGGAVYWPAGHYIGSGYDGITLRSGVSNFGDGYSSFLDFNWNAIKTEGVWGGAVTEAAWKNISSISGRHVTLATISDASAFSTYVGKLIMLRSSVMDAAKHTSFYETVKVKSVNVSTGIVELYDAIKDSIVSPQLAVSSYDLVQNVQLFGLRLRSSQPTVNMPLYIDGIYKSHIHHLWLEGAHGLAWNAVTKCSVHDIFCTVYAGSTNHDNLAIEIKYGSYDSSFDRIFVDIINTDSTADLMLMISIGERSRDIRINGVTINASDCNADLYGQQRAVRTNVKNVTAYLQNSRRVLSVSQSSGGGSLNSNSNFSDFEVYVSGVFGAGVIFDGGGSTERDIHARNIHIYGTQGAYSGKNYGSIYLGNNTFSCSVRNSNIQGMYTDLGSSNLILECLTSGPINASTRSKLSGYRNQTTYGTLAPPNRSLIVNGSGSVNTTVNNIINTLPLTQLYPYVAGDRFTLKVSAFSFGAGGTKNILITSTVGDFFSATIAAGSYAVDVDVEFIVLSAGGSSMSLRCSGVVTIGTTVSQVDYLRSIPTTSANSLLFEAWRVSETDSFFIYRSELKFVGFEV